MQSVRKSVLVPYPATAMFDLVDRVELYPQFLPWCVDAKALAVRADGQTARLDIDYHGVRAHFTTDNVNKAPETIVITLRDGHVMIADEPPGFVGGFGGENAGPTPTGFLAAAFAADIPAMLNRIARELGFEIAALKARVTIAWNPRGIAGAEGISPTPFEAVSDIWLTSVVDAATIEQMKSAYERRCPLHNLFRKAGCRMIENWHVEQK